VADGCRSGLFGRRLDAAEGVLALADGVEGLGEDEEFLAEGVEKSARSG
jgi:hypothetical protein